MTNTFRFGRIAGIAAVCLGLAVAVPLPPEVDSVVHWLGWINVTLLVFNLIPAFPLDGGRIMRAALWRATGNLVTATRWASTAGNAFALAMIAGVAPAPPRRRRTGSVM